MDSRALPLVRSPVKTRACENCIHFHPSVKEVQGRGLCVLYSLIQGPRDSCRFGFEPRAEQPVRVNTEDVGDVDRPA